MRTLSLSVCLAFAFFVASAVAQTAPGGSQGTQSSPTTQQPGQYPSQPGMGQGTVPSTDQNTANQHENNGEHTIKGCVQSQGGSYVLETKKGKDIALTGQDVSAHNGHEVALTGTWGTGNETSSTASTNAGGAEKTFNVTHVKHISDTCKMKSSSGSMGNSGAGTGTSSPSGTGQSAQPPQ